MKITAPDLRTRPNNRDRSPWSRPVLISIPHRGQWTGIGATVALSSMSNATKLCPQRGHVTLFASLNITNPF